MKILLTMLMLSIATYGNEVVISSEMEKTKWETYHEEEDLKLVFEFESPFIIIKSYNMAKNSRLASVDSSKITSYNNIDDLHIFFGDDGCCSFSMIFKTVSKDVLRWIIVGNSNVENLTLTRIKED